MNKQKIEDVKTDCIYYDYGKTAPTAYGTFCSHYKEIIYYHNCPTCDKYESVNKPLFNYQIANDGYIIPHIKCCPVCLTPVYSPQISISHNSIFLDLGCSVCGFHSEVYYNEPDYLKE